MPSMKVLLGALVASALPAVFALKQANMYVSLLDFYHSPNVTVSRYENVFMNDGDMREVLSSIAIEKGLNTTIPAGQLHFLTVGRIVSSGEVFPYRVPWRPHTVGAYLKTRNLIETNDPSAQHHLTKYAGNPAKTIFHSKHMSMYESLDPTHVINFPLCPGNSLKFSPSVHTVYNAPLTFTSQNPKMVVGVVYAPVHRFMNGFVPLQTFFNMDDWLADVNDDARKFNVDTVEGVHKLFNSTFSQLPSDVFYMPAVPSKYYSEAPLTLQLPPLCCFYAGLDRMLRELDITTGVPSRHAAPTDGDCECETPEKDTEDKEEQGENDPESDKDSEEKEPATGYPSETVARRLRRRANASKRFSKRCCGEYEPPAYLNNDDCAEVCDMNAQSAYKNIDYSRFPGGQEQLFKAFVVMYAPLSNTFYWQNPVIPMESESPLLWKLKPCGADLEQQDELVLSRRRSKMKFKSFLA